MIDNKENVNITDVLKNISMKKNNVFTYKDVMFCFDIHSLGIRIYILNEDDLIFLSSFSIYDDIVYLVERLQKNSKQCNFFCDDNIKHMRIKYIMKDGNYWIGKIKYNIYPNIEKCIKYNYNKIMDMEYPHNTAFISYDIKIDKVADKEDTIFIVHERKSLISVFGDWSYIGTYNFSKEKISDIIDTLNLKSKFFDFFYDDGDENMKTIDKCDNKDKVCKSRAECMREISEQNKFNVEEEFKKICLKERETLLENIHRAIELNAREGKTKIEFYLYQYMSKEFKIIGNTENGYYVRNGNTYSYFRDKFWCFTGTVELEKEVGPNSYVLKFVNKLDYKTAKRISERYVYDWIISKLNEEGFAVEFNRNKYGKISVEW